MMLSPASPARFVKFPLVERYSSSPLPIVLIEAVAEPSLAERRALSRLGMAIAAMIKMIATTINSSISEKPLVFLLVFFFMISPCRFQLAICFTAVNYTLLAVGFGRAKILESSRSLHGWTGRICGAREVESNDCRLISVVVPGACRGRTNGELRRRLNGKIQTGCSPRTWVCLENVSAFVSVAEQIIR